MSGTNLTFTSTLMDPLLYHHVTNRLELNSSLNWLNIFFNLTVAFGVLWSLKCLLTWSYQKRQRRVEGILNSYKQVGGTPTLRTLLNKRIPVLT